MGSNFIIYYLLSINLIYVNSQSSNCAVDADNNRVSDVETVHFVTLINRGDVEDIQIDENPYSKYVKVKPNSKDFDLLPTEEYQRYEETETIATMIFKLNLTCKDGTTYSKMVPLEIEDTNNHDPFFSEPSYEFELTMPFTKGLQINICDDETIKATDYDLSNVDITYTIEPNDDFIIKNLPKDNKAVPAVIMSKKLLKFTEDKVYTITAHDSGTPQRSIQTTLSIKVSHNDYTPSPNFNKAFYIINYEKDGENVIISGTTIIPINDGADVTIELEDPNGNFIATKLNDKEIKISLNAALDDEVLETKTYIPLTLIAKYDNDIVAKTAIIIHLPEKPQETTTNCPTVTTPTTVTVPVCTCPSTVMTTSCPEVTTLPAVTECPTVTECPPVTECPAITECPPVTECPAITECPPVTECPAITESPPVTECPSVTECPTCPVITECPTECPTTAYTTEKAVTCPPVTECPITGTTTEEVICATCPTCPPSVTECPITTTAAPCDCTTLWPSCPTCPTCTTITTTDNTTPTNFNDTTTVISTEATTAKECPTPTPEQCNCSTTTPAFTECPITTPCNCEQSSSTSAVTCEPCNCSSTTTSETCPICPTECPTITTPAECTTQGPSTPSPGTSIHFDKPLYIFTKEPTYKGVLTTIRAEAVPDETIRYKVEGNAYSGIDYNKKTGVLSITDYLQSGVYTFEIIAIGEETKNQAKTIVQIMITSAIVCDDDIPQFFTSYALKEVLENKAETIIIYDDEEVEALKKYIPNIIDIYPKFLNGNGPFEIDDKATVKLNKVDREDDVFKNMLIPQLRVTIQLERKDTRYTSRSKSLSKLMQIRDSDDDNDDVGKQCVIMPQKIANLQQTVITVIIEDENDNDPVFKDGKKLIIGYPEESIAKQITLPYVAVIEATDKDTGANAKIRYSLDTEDFVIHPHTGVLYLTEDSLTDDKKFNVFAIDMDGDGHKTKLEVEIQLLKSNQIIVLTLENVLLEDMEEKLQAINNKNLVIKPLTASVVGGKESTRILKRDTNRKSKDNYLKIIAYGMNKESEIYTNDEIKDLLKGTEELEINDIKSFINDQCDNKDDDEEEVIGYIIAVAILAVLLGAFIIVFIAIYFLKLRKNDNLVFTTGPYHDVADNPQKHEKEKRNERSVRRPTGFVFQPPVIEEDDETDTDNVYNNVIKYVDERHNNNNVTDQINNNDKFDKDDKEHRKSVSFVGMVEKIHIEEPDDDNESQRKDSVIHSDDNDDDDKEDSDQETAL